MFMEKRKRRPANSSVQGLLAPRAGAVSAPGSSFGPEGAASEPPRASSLPHRGFWLRVGTNPEAGLGSRRPFPSLISLKCISAWRRALNWTAVRVSWCFVSQGNGRGLWKTCVFLYHLKIKGPFKVRGSVYLRPVRQPR